MRTYPAGRIVKTFCLASLLLLTAGMAASQVPVADDQPSGCLSLRFDRTEPELAQLLATLRLEPIDGVESKVVGNSSISSQTYRATDGAGSPVIVKITCEGACIGQGCLPPSCSPFNGQCPKCTCNEGCGSACECAQSAVVVPMC